MNFRGLGLAIAETNEKIRDFVARVEDSLLLSRERREALRRIRLADYEGRSKLRYVNRIEAERQIGLAFVRAESRRVQRELGIDIENRSTP